MKEKPDVRDLVVADLEERYAKGLQDYGVPLQPYNGRNALWDTYEELLDAALYLRQFIYELDNRNGNNSHGETVGK